MARIGLWLATAMSVYAADSEATTILAKSVAAFQHNLEAEKHWNWTSTENREITDGGGKTAQKMPVVKSESVILGDGRRCNAATFWSDGHQPYLKDAPPEDRCLAYSSIGTPFPVALLLRSANVKITGRAPQ